MAADAAWLSVWTGPGLLTLSRPSEPMGPFFHQRTLAEDYFAQGFSSISDPEQEPRGQRRMKEGLTEEMERNESEQLSFSSRSASVHLSNQTVHQFCF